MFFALKYLFFFTHHSFPSLKTTTLIISFEFCSYAAVMYLLMKLDLYISIWKSVHTFVLFPAAVKLFFLPKFCPLLRFEFF